MVAIVDYGVGNLFSLCSSLKFIGQDAIITGNADEIKRCDRIILPGVGAFRDAAEKLRSSGLDDVVCSQARAGVPLLGVCLGMQMLFEKSYEYGEHRGLGLIRGIVTPIERAVPKGYKIPHIGWNSLAFPKGRPVSPLFKYIREGDFVYFVHSYHASDCDGAVIATTDYGGAALTAAVEEKNVFGTQFHPEKSGRVGLEILRAFCEMPPTTA